jgi:hypothetical protein
MAVVNTISTELTNLAADPIVVNDIHDNGGRVRVKSATVAVASGDDDGSTFRFFRVRSGHKIISLQCRCDLITAMTNVDCGLYTINGGALVDVDLYSDGNTLAVATPAIPHINATAPFLELRWGDITTSTIQDVNNKVWEDLGLSEDPGLEYDIVLTAVTVGSANGDIALTMLYTAGD